MLENCYFYVDARRSGKSTKLLEEFHKTPNSIMIMPNKRGWLEKVPIFNRIYTQNFNEDSFRGNKFDKVFIDEYLLYSIENQIKINQIIPLITKEIVVRTTASFLIIRDTYKLVSFMRKENINRDYIPNFNDVLFDNLLTHPKTTIYNKYDSLHKFYSPDAFKTEILGQLFTL